MREVEDKLLTFRLGLIYYSGYKHWLQKYFTENIESIWASSFKIGAKIEKSFTRIGVSIWNSIPHSVKTLNLSNFRKKIKTLLLNTLDNEDNHLNVTYLIEYFKKLTWYVVYTSIVILVFFSNNKTPVLEFVCCCISFLFLLICNLITLLFIYFFVLPRLAL